jgi:hypothetical protein
LALFFLGVGSRKCGVVGLGTRGIGEVLFRSDWGDRFIYDPIIASARAHLYHGWRVVGWRHSFQGG